MGKLLTVEQAAAQLGVCSGTLRGMIRDGRLPVVRPTGKRAVRVREEDIETLTGVTTGAEK